MVSWNDVGLQLTVGDQKLCFPAVWLRDNCPCPGCLDPGTGQKLNDICEIPDGLAVTAAEQTGESVTVIYAPDGHRSVFSRSWLSRHALDDGRDDDGHTEDGRTEDDKELWLPPDLDPVPEAGWARYLSEPADRACLRATRVGSARYPRFSYQFSPGSFLTDLRCNCVPNLQHQRKKVLIL